MLQKYFETALQEWAAPDSLHFIQNKSFELYDFVY